MTLFSATAAAALELPSNMLTIVLYSFLTEVQFNVSSTGNRAPALMLSVLRQLATDDATIVFCDADANHIDIDPFPFSKAAFDELFSTSMHNGKLSCAIRSSQKSFHSIKVGVWDILQRYKIWFRKLPGPLKRLALSMMGFWVNVHPGFASPCSILEEIKADVHDNYKKTLLF
jgi:hypothetical protein